MSAAVLDLPPSPTAPPPASAGPARPGGRLDVLDVLRGVAVLLVVWYHSDASFLSDVGWRGLIKDIGNIGGQTGVALFLILSGFSIHLRRARSDKAERFGVWTFAKKRFLRIMPTYWVALVLTVVLLGISRQEATLQRPSELLWGGHQTAWFSVLNHLTVIGMNVFPAAYMMRGWSLAAEGQLYGLYAAVQRWWATVNPWVLVAGGLVISVLWRAAWSWVLDLGPTGQAHTLTQQVLIEWALPVAIFPYAVGYLGAEWWAGNAHVPRWITNVGVGGALLALAVKVHDGPLLTLHVAGRPIVLDQILWHPLVVVACGCLVLGAVRLEALVASRIGRAVFAPLTTTGRWSYSMYLIHTPLWLFTYEVLGLRGRWLGVSVGFTLIFAASGLMYRFVERPWARRSTAVGRPKPVAPRPQPVPVS